MMTVIIASPEQVDKLFRKHLRLIFGGRFSYDSDDKIGFVTLVTITGKTVNYRMKGGEPYFVEFTGFGNIRYDVHNPAIAHEKMYKKLKRWGDKVEKRFWKGGQI